MEAKTKARRALEIKNVDPPAVNARRLGYMQKGQPRYLKKLFRALQGFDSR